MILKIIGGLLNLTSFLAEYAGNKQLMDAGAAKVIAGNNHDSYQKLRLAIDAKRTTKLDADSLQNDKANRDGH